MFKESSSTSFYWFLIKFESQIKNESGCSFYSENSPQDLVNVYPHLINTLKRAEELMVEYDNHPALMGIKTAINRVLGLNLFNTPAVNVIYKSS